MRHGKSLYRERCGLIKGGVGSVCGRKYGVTKS